MNSAPNPALPDQQKWPSERRAGAHKHTGLPQQQASAAAQPQKIGRRSLATTTPRPGRGLSAPLHARGVTHWGARFKSAAHAKLRFDRAGAARQVGRPRARNPEPRNMDMGITRPLGEGARDHERPCKQFHLRATTAATLLGFRPENLTKKRRLILREHSTPSSRAHACLALSKCPALNTCVRQPRQCSNCAGR